MYEPPHLLPEIPRQHTLIGNGGFIELIGTDPTFGRMKLKNTASSAGMFVSTKDSIDDGYIIINQGTDGTHGNHANLQLLAPKMEGTDGRPGMTIKHYVDGDSYVNIGTDDSNPQILLTDYGGDNKITITGSMEIPSMATGTGTDLVITSGNAVVKKSSSIRYKNVADVNMSDHLSPSMIDFLEPKMFSYKSDNSNHPMIGLIAENCDSVSPFLAYHDNEQVESVDKDALVSLLIIALKDARTRIAALES
tara:strand:- start:26 stop:775 length:750 start_codon:yes stop_codon:yes gene_type:complete